MLVLKGGNALSVPGAENADAGNALAALIKALGSVTAYRQVFDSNPAYRDPVMTLISQRELL